MEKNASINKFIKHLCFLTLVVFAVSMALNQHLTVWWPAIVAFFFIVSIVIFVLGDKAKKKSLRSFSHFYMISTFVKMVSYITIIFLYAINNKEDGKRFAITFLAYYLIYSVFETFKLAKKDKNTHE